MQCRNDVRADECAVCINNFNGCPEAAAALFIDLGKLLCEDYGKGQGMFRVCSQRCKKFFGGGLKGRPQQTQILKQLRFSLLKTDLRAGDSVLTTSDLSPTRKVPKGVGVIEKVRYDFFAGRAEITVKLTIEGVLVRVWPDGLVRALPSDTDRASSRRPFFEIVNGVDEERNVAYSAQKRRATVFQGEAREEKRRRDEADRAANEERARADVEKSKHLIIIRADISS
jgi:hypothetical protein